jgi:hypothetical protein
MDAKPIRANNLLSSPTIRKDEKSKHSTLNKERYAQNLFSGREGIGAKY